RPTSARLCRGPERRAPALRHVARARRGPRSRCRGTARADRARARRAHVKVGLQLSSFTWPGGPPELAARLRDVARAAEESGFHSLWVMDHFFQIPPWGTPEDNPMLEAYATLGFLAAATEPRSRGSAWPRPIRSRPRFRSRVRDPRSSSAVRARSARSVWSRATRTRGTSSRDPSGSRRIARD